MLFFCFQDSIEQQYHHKGPKVVDMNKNAIDVSLANICKIDYPATWATTTDGGSRGGDDKNVPGANHQQIVACSSN